MVPLCETKLIRYVRGQTCFFCEKGPPARHNGAVQKFCKIPERWATAGKLSVYIRIFFVYTKTRCVNAWRELVDC